MTPARSRWEYAADELSLKGADIGNKKLLEWLDRLGANGWEVAHLSAVGMPGGGLVWDGVFKRALPSKRGER